MKIEIEKSEYDRLKSREEKLMAYYEWFIDKENDLATVEDIVNENIELRNTLEDVYKKKRELWMDKVRLEALSKHKTEMVMKLWKIKDELEEENKKLKEKVRFLEECLDNKEKVNKSLRAENEYLHKLLPEADWYIIEKQLEQRLWNDWEEDVYED